VLSDWFGVKGNQFKDYAANDLKGVITTI